MLRPVIGEPCHRTHPGQPDGGLFVVYLRGCRRELLVIHLDLLKLGIDPLQSSNGLGDLIAAVGDDQGSHRGRPGDGSEDQLHTPYIVMHRTGPGLRQVPRQSTGAWCPLPL